MIKNKKKLIDIIVGARPNFIKVAPIFKIYKNNKKIKKKIKFRLIHTGQHYDYDMSEIIFKQLKIPKPHVNFNIGSGSHAQQCSKIMLKYEETLIQKKSDYCIVVGDVNSTLACSITAKKLNVKVIHIEAGLRSNDMTMPEEINRIVTDSISDIYFTTSKYAVNNLMKEGVKKKNIYFVGNIMIDSLMNSLDFIKKPEIFKKLKLENEKYILLTLHRPDNVDNIKKLKNLILNLPSKDRLKIIFPVHPRTKRLLKNIEAHFKFINFIDPLSYFEFSYLLKKCLIVITDSGGVTEEATVYSKPCITVRNNTERPETVIDGTNILVGNHYKKISNFINKAYKGKWKRSKIPEMWDGKTATRILKILYNFQ